MIWERARISRFILVILAAKLVSACGSGNSAPAPYAAPAQTAPQISPLNTFEGATLVTVTRNDTHPVLPQSNGFEAVVICQQLPNGLDLSGSAASALLIDRETCST